MGPSAVTFDPFNVEPLWPYEFPAGILLGIQAPSLLRGLRLCSLPLFVGLRNCLGTGVRRETVAEERHSSTDDRQNVHRFGDLTTVLESDKIHKKAHVGAAAFSAMAFNDSYCAAKPVAPWHAARSAARAPAGRRLPAGWCIVHTAGAPRQHTAKP